MEKPQRPVRDTPVGETIVLVGAHGCWLLLNAFNIAGYQSTPHTDWEYVVTNPLWFVFHAVTIVLLIAALGFKRARAYACSVSSAAMGLWSSMMFLWGLDLVLNQARKVSLWTSLSGIIIAAFAIVLADKWARLEV